VEKTTIILRDQKYASEEVFHMEFALVKYGPSPV